MSGTEDAGEITTDVLIKALGNVTEDELPGAAGPKELQHGIVIVSACSQHFMEGSPVHGVEYEQDMATTMVAAAKERTCVMLVWRAMTVPGETCWK